MNELDRKTEVRKWAYNLLKQDFVVLDTETSDFLDRGGEIIQLGIIDKFGKTLYKGNFKPKGKISPGASKIHGLTEDQLKDSPTWAEEFPKIAELLKGKLIIAYNVDFDKPIVEQTCKLWDVPCLDNKWDCAMLAYAKYHGEYNNYHQDYTWKKLTDAIESFKLTVENAHDALGDVIMTLKVIERLASEYPRME
jgi:DNA polymerase-3 subunit epsilon